MHHTKYSLWLCSGVHDFGQRWDANPDARSNYKLIKFPFRWTQRNVVARISNTKSIAGTPTHPHTHTHTHPFGKCHAHEVRACVCVCHGSSTFHRGHICGMFYHATSSETQNPSTEFQPFGTLTPLCPNIWYAHEQRAHFQHAVSGAAAK